MGRWRAYKRGTGATDETMASRESALDPVEGVTRSGVGGGGLPDHPLNEFVGRGGR